MISYALSLRGIAARAACAASLVLGAAAGCSKSADAGASGRPGGGKAPAAPVNITLAVVKLQHIERGVDVVGSLCGDEDTVVSAKVAGRIAAVYKDIGDRANPDEVLLQVEKTDYDLAVSQKDLAVREVLAKLSLKDLPGAEFDPREAPAVRKARIQADNAQAKLTRGKQLHDQQPPLLSDQDYADLETAAAVATSAYEVELVGAKALLAEALSRKADLQIARQHLKDTTVVVPPSHEPPGSAPAAAPATQPAFALYAISARTASIGEYVKEGTPLFKLVDDDPVKLRALVPERYVAQVRVGQKARVAVEAYTEPFWGEVDRINPEIDPASRTFQVEVVISNDKRLLKPGGFAKAWIRTHVDEKVMFVPRQAVQSFAGVSKVFVVKAGKAAEVLVETGLSRGELVEVSKGLSGGEQVVATGLNKIANDVPVIVGSAKE